MAIMTVLKHSLLSSMKKSTLHYASKVWTPFDCLKFTDCFIWNIFLSNHWIRSSLGTFLHAQHSGCMSQSQGVQPKVLLWCLHVGYLLTYSLTYSLLLLHAPYMKRVHTKNMCRSLTFQAVPSHQGSQKIFCDFHRVRSSGGCQAQLKCCCSYSYDSRQRGMKQHEGVKLWLSA